MSNPNDLDLASPMRPMEVAARAGKVRSALGSTCSALLVTKPANIRWLTGFTGSNAALVVADQGLAIATDGRYRIQVNQQLAAAGVSADIIIERDVVAALCRPLADHDVVGLESHHITWKQQQHVADALSSSRLVGLDNLVEMQRRTKDVGELDRLRRAAAIADRALASVMGDLPSQPSEIMVARRLETVMADLGAEEPSFPTIVAAGPNSARPHAVPSSRTFQPGDLLVIDMGARVDGYGSDMTRTFSVGPFSEKTESMYRAVVDAQAAGVDAVAAGVAVNDVDAACRDLLNDRGLGDAFIHGTGHGIGLEIHELPFLSKTGSDRLPAGTVVTVEPGVYLADVGGVRIEDSVIVTENGCEPITHSPKQPIIR
jgi:Xaa-Pro aminopeptidase